MNTETRTILDWIIRCIIEEDFSIQHLRALAYIVGLMNDCAESEAEILAFAEQLYEKYAG